MKKFILGFTLGAFVIGIASVIIVRSEQKRWFALGHKNGMVTGRAQAARAIHAEFGSLEGKAETMLFMAKPSRVVSTTVNGVKTIRVAE